MDDTQDKRQGRGITRGWYRAVFAIALGACVIVVVLGTILLKENGGHDGMTEAVGARDTSEAEMLEALLRHVFDGVHDPHRFFIDPGERVGVCRAVLEQLADARAEIQLIGDSDVNGWGIRIDPRTGRAAWVIRILQLDRIDGRSARFAYSVDHGNETELAAGGTMRLQNGAWKFRVDDFAMR